MVKVSIRDYMPPYTTWMQVELEDGFCASSPVQNPETAHNGKVDTHAVKDDFSYTLNDKENWD